MRSLKGNPIALSALRHRLQWLVGLLAIGWLNSLYTLWHRQSLFLKGLESPSFCRLSETIDCDSVALSNFSSVWGFPTSAFGMFFYALAFTLVVWIYFLFHDGELERLRKALSLNLTMAVVAIFPTVSLALISFFVLKTLCLMCLFTYLINLAYLGLSFSAWRQAQKVDNHPLSFSQAFRGGLRDLPSSLWITAGVLLLIHGLMPRMIEQMIPNAPQMDEGLVSMFVQRWEQSPQRLLRTTEGDFPAHGPANAPVTIVEFSDFQCPHCQHSAKTLPAILKSYGDKVRYVFKNYPLDPSCNPNMNGGGGHSLACLAAKTGYCVFRRKGNDAFFDYKMKVFNEQEKLNPERIREAATESGLADAEVQACVDDPNTNQAIVDQISEAKAAGVEGTPALFVNGRWAEMGPHPKTLKAILDRALQK